jgi:hypothetical protein
MHLQHPMTALIVEQLLHDQDHVKSLVSEAFSSLLITQRDQASVGLDSH